ncbi:MAG TPA: nicotinate phosphoribosyltransferase [Acidimicrobiales bacterium]|nr:nicotinate phosphoribosyltransferase [Acidimicrobiales bacterium]
MRSTALLTDHYELTMLDAALEAGTAGRQVVFEVFTRSLPAGRRYGVFAGLGRVLDALDGFRFGTDELDWLSGRRIVSDRTLEWLAGYRFGGDVYAYPEGELYTGGSPVLAVEGTFAEAVLLETMILSVLNHDSAVAAAASLICVAAGDRPVIEMGSRRTDPEAAVAAARAAYVAGLASTSNLEAGRRYGIPTAGTAAHSFVLLFDDEREAFDAQIAALGPATTLLVDTYDTATAIRLAVEAAGPGLGAVRIDSGDLGSQAVRARAQLDALGAAGTRVVVTGDLDERSINRLSSTPVDGYGAGTSVVMGGGFPTCGFVYKLVSVEGRPVQKRSPGKETVGGRKWAWRSAEEGLDVVACDRTAGPEGSRPLLQQVVVAGSPRPRPALDAMRALHARSRAELGPDRTLRLARR